MKKERIKNMENEGHKMVEESMDCTSQWSEKEQMLELWVFNDVKLKKQEALVGEWN